MGTYRVSSRVLRTTTLVPETRPGPKGPTRTTDKQRHVTTERYESKYIKMVVTPQVCGVGTQWCLLFLGQDLGVSENTL